MKIIPKEKSVVTMSPNHSEVARASSGETVIFEAYDCFTNELQSEDDKVSSIGMDSINPATGPLYVEGAEPGDTLKVEILDIEIEDQGVMTTHPEMGGLAGVIEEEITRLIPIRDNHAIFNDKIKIPLNPMVGVIGTAPKEEEIATGIPGEHGGNLDCKRVKKDTTVYLPVNVPGGMLSMGDAHAAMGDGEVIVCGLEIPAKITVKVTVLKGVDYPLPFLADEDHVMTLASAETLDEAASDALKNMHHFLNKEIDDMMSEEIGLLLSAVGDLKICQIVNPQKTSRMEVPKWILDQYDIKLK